MKLYNKIKSLSLFSMLLTQGMVAQMNTWVTPPVKYDMTSITSATAALYPGAPSTGGYDLANGACDINGTLLFYVHGGYVMNPSGTQAGELGGNFSGSWMGASGPFQGEVSIVPIPGTCKKFYVIYIRTDDMGIGSVFYTKVDCTSGVSVINNGSVVFFSGPLGGSFHGYPAFYVGGTGTTTSGLAVSQIVSGADATALRYLYTCGTNGIVQYDITSSGISNAYSFGTLGSLTSNDYGTLELELSPNRDFLAWSSVAGSSPTNMVHIQALNTANGHNLTTGTPLHSYSLNSIKGLEFDKTAAPVLYVIGGTTGTNVYGKINTATNSFSALTGTGYDLSNSFLELAKNGRMYAVAQGATPKLASIGLPTGTIASGLTKAINFDSRHNYSPWAGSVYTLPDQVDGQNYSDFAGYGIASLNPITINGLQLFYTTGPPYILLGDCDGGGVRDFYTCNAITLNPSYAGGTGTSYKIELFYVDPSTCTQVTGGTHMNYATSWTAGTVPTIDLRSLTDGSGNTLYTSSGYHMIKVSVQNACGIITYQTGYLNVLQAALAINLQIYDYTNPGTPMSPSHSLGSPNNMGTSSLGFKVDNTTGSYASMNVLVEQYSGGVYNTILNETRVPPSNYQNLNNFCVAAGPWGGSLPGINPACSVSVPSAYIGEPGFFSANNGANSYNNTYRLTVTLTNPCGSSSDYAFLKPVAKNLRLGDSRADNFELSGNSATIYPNPASNELNINLVNETSDVYTITLFDVTGKLVKTIANNMPLAKGSQTININTSDLPQGIYTYKINSANLNQTGLVSISK